MNGEIIGRGGIMRGEDRALARAKRDIIEEVEMADYKASGIMALARRVCERVVDLDEDRRALARRGGPELNALLVDIEVTAIEQVQRIQRDLFKNF